MARLLWICLGGAVGAGARHLLSGWLFRLTEPGFPFGTLIVNATRSFFLGLLMPVATAEESISTTLRLALTTGVVGGFTTYSTFNYETLVLFQKGAWLLGLANLGATLVVCLAAGGLGLAASRFLTGAAETRGGGGTLSGGQRRGERRRPRRLLGLGIPAARSRGRKLRSHGEAGYHRMVTLRRTWT